MIEYRRHWLRGPTGVASVNRSSPLSVGLAGLWLFNGRNPHNLITGERYTPSNAGFQTTPFGVALDHTATNSSTILAANQETVLGGFQRELSFGIYRRKTDATARTARTLSNGSSTASEFVAVYTPYTPNLTGLEFTSSGSLLSTALSWGTDAYVMSTGSRGMRLHQNGVFAASNASNATRTANSALSLYLGDDPTSDSSDLMQVYTVAIWRRQLTDAESNAWTRNPWQLFAPRRIYVPVGAAPTLPTLTALTPINVTGATAVQRYIRA